MLRRRMANALQLAGMPERTRQCDLREAPSADEGERGGAEKFV